MIEAPEHHQVLAAGQVLVDGGVLAGQADLSPQRSRVAHDVEAGHVPAAPVGRQQRRQDADGGRLPGSVGAEDAQHGAGRHLEVDAAQGLHVAVGLAQPADFYCEIGRPAR